MLAMFEIFLSGSRGQWDFAHFGLVNKVRQQVVVRASANHKLPVSFMEQSVRAHGEIQVFGFRLHGSRYLGGNYAEQIAKFVIDRAAAVPRTDGRGAL